MSKPTRYVVLVSELFLGEQNPIAVCSSSYVAVGFLEQIARDRKGELVAIWTNKHYRIGDQHYGLERLPLHNLRWLRKQEANQ